MVGSLAGPRGNISHRSNRPCLSDQLAIVAFTLSGTIRLSPITELAGAASVFQLANLRFVEVMPKTSLTMVTTTSVKTGPATTSPTFRATPAPRHHAKRRRTKPGPIPEGCNSSERFTSERGRRLGIEVD